MSDWLHNLPAVWMAPIVFGFTYMVAAAIQAVVAVLAVGERGRSFEAITPGMLAPLGAAAHRRVINIKAPPSQR